MSVIRFYEMYQLEDGSWQTMKMPPKAAEQIGVGYGFGRKEVGLWFTIPAIETSSKVA